MSFTELCRESFKKFGSCLCVGLDSDIRRMPKVLSNETNPQLAFNIEIIDATKEYAAAYKPNLAFYLSNGIAGLQALKDTITYIPKDIPVILDAKFGDIGNTMQAYFRYAFDVLSMDALTVNPLMGGDVMAPLESYPGKYLFLLCITSNKSASDYLLVDGLYKKIGSDIRKNQAQMGAVVGATQAELQKEARQLMPKNIFLVPGVGAQGGDAAATVKALAISREEPGILVNSSRGIIFADSGKNFAEAAHQAAKKLASEMRAALESLD